MFVVTAYGMSVRKQRPFRAMLSFALRDSSRQIVKLAAPLSSCYHLTKRDLLYEQLAIIDLYVN